MQIFRSVAKNLSFTRASEELFLTQPAVSMQIKQLENTVGIPLYEQLGKKIYLTEAGNLMLILCNNINSQLNDIEKEFDNLKGVDGGLLKISVATTVNYYAAHQRHYSSH